MTNYFDTEMKWSALAKWDLVVNIALSSFSTASLLKNKAADFYLYRQCWMLFQDQ